MEADKEIRAWIMSKPGPISGDAPMAVFTKVQESSGMPGSLLEVKSALWRYGYELQQKGKRWLIGFPESEPKP